MKLKKRETGIETGIKKNDALGSENGRSNIDTNGCNNI